MQICRSNKQLMIYAILIIVFLLLVLSWQAVLFSKTKRRHEQRMQALQGVVARLTHNCELREQQARLSEELLRKLRVANNSISAEIAALIKDFVGRLSDNDLID